MAAKKTIKKQKTTVPPVTAALKPIPEILEGFQNDRERIRLFESYFWRHVYLGPSSFEDHVAASIDDNGAMLIPENVPEIMTELREKYQLNDESVVLIYGIFQHSNFSVKLEDCVTNYLDALNPSSVGAFETDAGAVEDILSGSDILPVSSAELETGDAETEDRAAEAARVEVEADAAPPVKRPRRNAVGPATSPIEFTIAIHTDLAERIQGWLDGTVKLPGGTVNAAINQQTQPLDANFVFMLFVRKGHDDKAYLDVTVEHKTSRSTELVLASREDQSSVLLRRWEFPFKGKLYVVDVTTAEPVEPDANS